MVDCDFVSDHIHDDDDGDCEEDTRIDGERGAATRDRIISCTWQTSLLWMEGFWHFYYGEHHDYGDDGDDGDDDDESRWWTSWSHLVLQHKYICRKCRTENNLRLVDWQGLLVDVKPHLQILGTSLKTTLMRNCDDHRLLATKRMPGRSVSAQTHSRSPDMHPVCFLS